MALARAPRLKKCKVCPTRFVPRTSFHVACSPACSIELTRRQGAREKQRSDAKARAQRRKLRAEIRAARERMKTRREWVQDAQQVFNKYIRLRDAEKPCICCGRKAAVEWSRGGVFDAGHYRSVGSAPHLRFNEDNCHAQLKSCNRYGAGRAVDYRAGLIIRIGLERVEELEADQTVKKYTTDDLKEIVRKYRAKAREIERGLQHGHAS